jgi:hypothetical protein
VGLLWTPGYWGFVGGVYAFHVGYWGPHVGFYGGVNYGFGYGGVGFAGGRWVGNSFAYNRAVVNVNVVNVHNTYNETVVNNVNVHNRVSFNGGAGGIEARPSLQERTYAAEPHVQPTPMQHQHVQEAFRNPALAAKANGGHPAIAATARPGAFSGPGVVGAHGAAMTPAAAAAMHPQGHEPGAAPAVAPGRPGQSGQYGQAGQHGQPAPYAQTGQQGATKTAQSYQPGAAQPGAAKPAQPGQPGTAKPAAQPGQPAAPKPAKTQQHPKPAPKNEGEKEK